MDQNMRATNSEWPYGSGQGWTASRQRASEMEDANTITTQLNSQLMASKEG